MMMKFPIFLITGASGSGKTTIIPELYKICPEYIVLDLDALQNPLGQDWNLIKNTWIQVANQLTLNNKVSILCGTFMPEEFTKIDAEGRFIPYFIGLHCSDEDREKRLKERGWSEEFIQEHKQFNSWLVNNADKAFNPNMSLVDTSYMTPDKAATEVKKIINRALNKVNIERTEDIIAGTLDNLREVVSLALELWPHHTYEDLEEEFTDILQDKDQCILLYKSDGIFKGFIQMSLRHDYVEGSSTSPVGFIEGIFVKKEFRLMGVAKALVRSGEEWSRLKGCSQIGSDIEEHNMDSYNFHKRIGYTEVNRVICFLKDL